LADAVVLSCEVGCAKPDPRISRRALDQLCVTACAAAFADDQPAYCAGAAAGGMTALQIARGQAEKERHAQGPGVRLAESRGITRPDRCMRSS